ncbi:choloylglycine hydrolase [Lactiplantibacillus plantarum]|nr:choloylglycine hydrolase [Lactiplantibacillus plantarum]
MFSVVTKYHKGRHSLFLYNSEIFYAFTQDILRSQINSVSLNHEHLDTTELISYPLRSEAQYYAVN